MKDEVANKVIWEGWTVLDFVEALDDNLRLIMIGRSWMKPFTTKEELKLWCIDNQPYYKKHIPEVVDYFAKVYNLK